MMASRRGRSLYHLLRALPAHLASASAAQRAVRHDGGSPVGPLDAIVVLGHRPALDGAGLEYETRARVEHGVSLFRAGLAPWLMFAGGESMPGVVEADVMAEHAQLLGVPASALLRERDSLDTLENARLSLALLRVHAGLARPARILLVTSDYHGERAGRVFRDTGAAVQLSAVTLALPPAERARRARGESWVRACYRVYDGLLRRAAAPREPALFAATNPRRNAEET
jgi:uncharacterized SAM-binding protein YcdF (DUF218 family)